MLGYTVALVIKYLKEVGSQNSKGRKRMFKMLKSKTGRASLQ
jgi:hypothetical protein